MRLYSHDAFALLDPAWRILNGQIPYADFFDNLGPVSYLPTAAGLLLAGGKAEGFGYGQALCAFILGCWAYLLSRDRLPDPGRILLCLVIVSFAAAPFALGDPATHISPATTYNRYGYAFVALILLESLMAPPNCRRRNEFAGGISTGVILILLLFLKITFFIGAVALVAVLAACRRQVRARWTGLAGGFLAMALLFLVYLRFDLRPMWNGLVILVWAKHVRKSDYHIASILESAGLLWVFALSISWFLAKQNRASLARSAFLSGGAVCAVGLTLIFTCYEKSGFPLQAVFAILLLELLNKGFHARSLVEKAFQISMVLWAGVLIMTSLAPSALSLSYGVAQKIRHYHQYESMQSPPLRGFVPVKEESGYGPFVNDGMTLINQHKQPGDSVISLDFTNPFSYGLGMKPARGGAIALQYGTTLNDRHKPSPEWLLGHTSLVMVPKHPSDGERGDKVIALYEPYLREQFSPVSESEHWKLYRNRPTRLVVAGIR